MLNTMSRSLFRFNCKTTGWTFSSKQRTARSIYSWTNTHFQQPPPYSSTTSLPSPAQSFLPVPFVTTEISGASHTTDLFSRLLKERIVCVFGPIEDRMAATIVASLLYLESESEAPISVYINSPGGSVSSGLSIYDTLQYITPEIHTICMGTAASMGSLLLAAGSPGKRYTLTNSTVMVHQPSGGFSGTSADIALQAKEILRLRDLLNNIYKKHLNDPQVVERRGNEMSLTDIERLMDRDYFMSAEEALKLGIVDEVLQSRKKLSQTEQKN